MKYFKPGSVEEALELLSKGVPLAGGTALVPERSKLDAVIDLEDLGFDQIEISPDAANIGAATKLQTLLDPEFRLPGDLKRACRHEAAWNLRNMATVGGTIMSADARSPLLVTLLALKAQVMISGESAAAALDEVLDRRSADEKVLLLEALQFNLPARLRYEYVARAPADRPLVSAAAASFGEREPLSAAIGGFGERPLALDAVEGGAIEAAKAQAAERYETAGDAFASAEYRSEIASILVERVLLEVRS